MKYKTNEDKSCRKHLNERVFVFFLFLTGSFWDAGVGQLGNGTLDVIDLDRRSKKLSRRVAVVSFRQTGRTIGHEIPFRSSTSAAAKRAVDVRVVPVHGSAIIPTSDSN